jgi:hypothetical protein
MQVYNERDYADEVSDQEDGALLIVFIFFIVTFISAMAVGSAAAMTLLGHTPVPLWLKIASSFSVAYLLLVGLGFFVSRVR